MKRSGIVFAVLFFLIFSLGALISCGGGSSSGSVAAETDFVSITVEGAGTTLYTETTSTQADNGYSPYIYVLSTPTPSVTTYLYSLDWDGSNYVPRFQITVWGSGTGTYNISNSGFVFFAPAIGPAYQCMKTLSNTSGTITFTQFGSPGEKVKGTFDVISANTSSLSQTVHLTGSFTANRY
jgi:hypothetical protein